MMLIISQNKCKLISHCKLFIMGQECCFSLRRLSTNVNVGGETFSEIGMKSLNAIYAVFLFGGNDFKMLDL